MANDRQSVTPPLQSLGALHARETVRKNAATFEAFRTYT